MNVELLNFKSIAQSKYNGTLNYIDQLSPTEPQHSAILGNILDPRGKHGCGGLFLKEFFKCVFPDGEITFDENENWLVTIELERFDIQIKTENDTKIVIVENKSNWAVDQPNQLYRYWLNGIHNRQKNIPKTLNPKAKILYASPAYGKAYEEQSITRPDDDTTSPLKVPEGIIKIIYFNKEIMEWLENCMHLVDGMPELYYYLKQYKDYWEARVMADVVNQVEDLFCDKEQWTSFLELAAQKKYIWQTWWQTFQAPMTKCFTIDNPMEIWGFTSFAGSDCWDFRWYLSEFGDKSLCLWAGNYWGKYSLLLWADSNQHDPEKISNLLKEPEYSPIISAFESPYCNLPPNEEFKIVDQGDYIFDGSKVIPLVENMAWYAHYKPEKFVSLMLKKVDRFRKDATVTDLLRKINIETRKNP